jgi:hypothetical protein
MKMTLNFENDDCVWHGWNCIKLRVWEAIMDAIKSNMTLNFENDDWVWHGWNCIKLRVWEAIMGAIKSNWKKTPK